MKIALIIIGILLLIVILIYNNLISKRNDVKNSFATVDVMLKRRFDLIPNLVATVKQYAAYEIAAFSKITEFRKQNFESLSNEQKQIFADDMKNAVAQYFVVAEAYPQLKASDNFLQLQRSLNETEEQLAAARRTYNAAVTNYNNSIQTFPNVIFAKMFGFKHYDLYKIKQSESNVPK